MEGSFSDGTAEISSALKLAPTHFPAPRVKGSENNKQTVEPEPEPLMDPSRPAEDQVSAWCLNPDESELILSVFESKGDCFCGSSPDKTRNLDTVRHWA